MRKRSAFAILLSSLGLMAGGAWAAAPLPDQTGMPEAVTAVARQAHFMHNSILTPIIFVIALFVLALMIYIIVRFRAGANPTPSTTTHNTLIEVVWTVIPILILTGIAVPSFKLLYAQYDQPPADLTIKITGHQWYWSYEYPDQGNFSFDSIMLTDEEAKAKSEPRLLGVDNEIVVPVGKTVKLLVTAADVIHAWAIPAFYLKMDAVPGRVNETWFNADKVGVYYGQCSELCGTKHGFMPIAVRVVEPEQFAAWVKEAQAKYAGTSQPVQFASASPAVVR